MKLQISKSILLLSLLLFLTSCHTKYISLDYKIMHGAMWNNEQTQIAFFVSKKAYRAPKGIARFPDGGISKTIFTEVSLYSFNPENKILVEALTFDSFPSSESIKIAYTDSLIYYFFVMDWDYQLYFAKTEADSQRVYNLKEKYARPFVFNEKTRELSNADTSAFLTVYNEDNRVDYMTLHNQISELPISELGLVINEIYPKSDKEYINDFLSSGGNNLTRRAIAEQIISKLSKEEIRDILKKLDEHKNSLDGFERKQFEFFSKDRYELLEKLL